MNEELKRHIELFPSKFDTTSIAQQLVKADVPVRVYADVRDQLWNRLMLLKDIRAEVESHILDARENLDEAMLVCKETWR